MVGRATRSNKAVKENVEAQDRIEAVSEKSYQLMELLMTSDADPEKVRFAAASLQQERQLVMQWDENLGNEDRSALYDLSAAIERMCLWYVDKEEKVTKDLKIKKEEPAGEGYNSEVSSKGEDGGRKAGNGLKKVKVEFDDFPDEDNVVKTAPAKTNRVVKQEMEVDEHDVINEASLAKRRRVVKQEIDEEDEKTVVKSPPKKKKNSVKKTEVKAAQKQGTLEKYMKKK